MTDGQREAVAVRFLRLVRFEEGGHWIWIGAKRGRLGREYGAFRVNRKTVATHRASFELFREEIGDDLDVHHECGIPACVNPWHEELVTRREHLLKHDGFGAVNARKTECIRGHKFAPENTRMAKGGRGRVCRACERDRDRRGREYKWGRSRKPRTVESPVRTHFRCGHEISDANTYVYGKRKACRDCKIRRATARYYRLKERDGDGEIKT